MVDVVLGNGPNTLSGSPERRIDMHPDGTLWCCVVINGNPGKAKFFYSKNGGATWTYSDGSDVSLGQATGTPSFYIDAQGNGHLAWVQWSTNPQVIKVSYGGMSIPDYLGGGAPSSSERIFWRTASFAPSGGRTGNDCDIVAFKIGSTVHQFVTYSMAANGGAQVAHLTINSSATPALSSNSFGPSGPTANQYGSLEFNHTGDGKTPRSNPNLFLSVAGPSSSSMKVYTATYVSTTWVWGSTATIGTFANPKTTMQSVFDSANLMVAYSNNSSTILVSEVNGTTAVSRNPPSAPGGTGTVLGLAMAHDPATDNLHLAYYDATDGDIFYSKFTRATLTWSAWTSVLSRGSYTYEGKIGVVRHPLYDAVDLVYGTGSPDNIYTRSMVLAPLVRTPNPPILVAPAAGVVTDLTTYGATFSWTYSGVSPGDSQQAFAFRRKTGGTTEYWNAGSQSWSSTIVWNPGATGSVSIPAGAWATGQKSWSVAARSTGGGDSAFATDRTVTSTVAPSLSVDEPTAVSYSTSSPLVEWTYTSSSPQKDYIIRVFADSSTINPDVTTPLWDSGTVTNPSARMQRIGVALTNGAAYRAYMRVTSATGVQSAWQYSSFTVSLQAPIAPVVTGYSELAPVSNIPRIHLDLISRASLLTEDQNSGLDGWENDANATVAHQVDDPDNQILEGLLVTSVAAGTVGVRTEPGTAPLAPVGEPALTGPLSFPVVAGQAYTGVASFKAATTSRTARVVLRWYDLDDGTGALLSSSVGSTVAVSNVGYAQALVTATAPTGARLARVVLEVVGPTAAGEAFYVAQPSLAPGTSTTWQPGGYSTTQTLVIERSVDQVTWEVITSGLGATLAGFATFTDRLMPMGVPVYFRAFTEVDRGNGDVLRSDPSAVAMITVTALRWTVRDLIDADVEWYALVVGHRRSDDESSAVHRPAGREFPIVDTEGPQAATGVLSIFVAQADVTSATAVLRSTVAMRVQSPSGFAMDARLISRDYNVEQSRHRIIDVRYVQVR